MQHDLLLIEVKAVKSLKQLKPMALKAQEQIREKRYASGFQIRVQEKCSSTASPSLKKQCYVKGETLPEFPPSPHDSKLSEPAP